MDSDDEYERGRRRDKFRRERSDYRDRRERDDRRRDNWTDRRDGRENYRNDWNRRPYQNYSRGRSDNYRDQMSPPNKRPRRDWEPNYYDRYGSQGYSQGGWNQSRDKGPRRSENDSSQLLSFKQFLATQDDTIDDQEAVKKYNEYKLEYKKGQLSDFFLVHKDEEWFKMKYHPDDRDRENYKKLVRLRQRLHIFMEIFEKEVLSRAGMDASSAPELMKIMDTIVIKLEGGTDFDLEVLEEIPDSEDKSDREEEKGKSSEKKVKPPEPKIEEDGSKSDSKEEGEADDEDEKKPEPKVQEKTKEDHAKSEQTHKKKEKKADSARPPEPPEPPAEDDKKKQRKKKRKEREYSYSSDESSSSGSDSDSDSESEPAPPGVDNEGDKSSKAPPEPPKSTEEVDEKKAEGDKPPKPEEPDDEPKPRALHKTFSLFFRNIAPVLTKKEIVDVCKRYKGYLRVALAEPSPERSWNRHGWVTFDRSVNIKEICWNLSNLRLKDCELSPVVNRDLTHRIRAVSGITAHKTVVKTDLKLAARLIQLLDEESKVWDKLIMPTNPDKEPEPPAPPKEEEKEEKKPAEPEQDDAPKPPEEPAPPPPPTPPKPPAEPPVEIELLTPPAYEKNPVLENITEFLVDETSAEEQLLLGSDLEEREEGQEDSNEIQFERDPQGSKVLDRLLCYLRFVHSVDYYSCSRFHIEDDMPSRCGLVHVRGANPPSRMTQKDLDAWKTNFERKLTPLVSKKGGVSKDDLSKLGKKDQEAEVQKFITANTQELAKDKWLCPLSGKKFKGPEFVRKHIFNKHSEKIDSVRKEVEYFNNYLGDEERPQPPDPTPAATQPPPPQNQGGGGGGGGQGGFNQQQQQQGNFNNFGGPGNQPPPQQPPQGGNNFNRGGGGGGGGGGNFNQQGGNFGGNNFQQPQPQAPLRSNYDPYGYTPPSYSRQGGSRRPIIQYRDLDAPDSSDFF